MFLYFIMNIASLWAVSIMGEGDDRKAFGHGLLTLKL